MLEYAEKYNWWTPKKDLANISLEAKIEYILKYGRLQELKMMISETGIKKISEVSQSKKITPKWKNIWEVLSRD